MTSKEIDKWVEEHIDCPETSPMRKHYEPILQWGKIIAHKFYELGKQEGKKVVDYTAAFEGYWKDNPILKPTCDDNR